MPRFYFSAASQEMAGHRCLDFAVASNVLTDHRCLDFAAANNVLTDHRCLDFAVASNVLTDHRCLDFVAMRVMKWLSIDALNLSLNLKTICLRSLYLVNENTLRLL